MRVQEVRGYDPGVKGGGLGIMEGYSQGHKQGDAGEQCVYGGC